jgi:hypothetical protein
MEKITSIQELKKAIVLLEIKQANEGALLKEQLMETYESLKPVNLIKKSLSDLTTSPDFRDDLLGTTMSLVAGFLSKKAVVGSTHNPIKNVLGTILQIGVTNLVSKNSDGIKAVGMKLINSFFHKKETVD